MNGREEKENREITQPTEMSRYSSTNRSDQLQSNKLSRAIEREEEKRVKGMNNSHPKWSRYFPTNQIKSTQSKKERRG
jgi:hypothetical protein